MYDFAIVGAGPSGLTVAWCLSKLGKKVVLIEKQKAIGGAHRVLRVNGLLTEHSPRMYFNNYFTLDMLLREMGTSFEEQFTPYGQSVRGAIKESISNLSRADFGAFLKAFIQFIYDDSYSKQHTMDQFMNESNFSESSRKFIDAICRTTSGSDSSRYTLYEFLQILNQSCFYTTYQPKHPTDVGLFNLWEKKMDPNVDILKNVEVVNIHAHDGRIRSLTLSDHKTIVANCFILATRPKDLLSILSNSSPSIKNSFGDYNLLKKWERETRYLEVISITFHWDTEINFEDKWGYAQGDWGIIFIVLTRSMKFMDPRSKTVISVAITLLDAKSNLINKTPQECNEDELKDEALYQIKKLNSGTRIPKPTAALLSPTTYRQNDRWVSSDANFTFTKYGYGPFKSSYSNLYTVGAHNGFSQESATITSMESAMYNAVHLVHELIPQSVHRYPNKHPITLVQALGTITGMSILFSLYRVYQNRTE